MRFGYMIIKFGLILILQESFTEANKWGWNGGGNTGRWKHGGGGFNSRRQQNKNNFYNNSPQNSNRYSYGFNNNQFGSSQQENINSNNHYFINHHTEAPTPVPTVSFHQAGLITNCGMPTMGDMSKFELRCIPPDSRQEVECSSLSSELASGTTVMLRCKPPYVNEEGDMRIWVCENGIWQGEFKALGCITSSAYNTGTNYQTSQPAYSWKQEVPTPAPSYGFNNSYNNQNYSNNNHYYQPSQPTYSWQQELQPPSPTRQPTYSWQQELQPPSPAQPEYVSPSTSSATDNVIDSLFPNLFQSSNDTGGGSGTVPSWQESGATKPWNSYDYWWKPSTTTTMPPTTTSTMPPTTSTTTMPPTTTTTTMPPTTTTTVPPTTTTTTPRPYQPSPIFQEENPNFSNWNAHYNQNSEEKNNFNNLANNTTKCSSLSKRLGVSLECLSKSPVPWDPSSFIVSQNDCQAPQAVGTEATYKCLQYYEASAGLTIQYRKCKDEGTWTGGDNGFSCALECGKSNPVGRLPLITHGEPTYRAQWPWHAAIFFKEKKKDPAEYAYNCGATLINRRSVLTAAHCVTKFFSKTLRKRDDFRIDLGRYERTEDDEFVQSFSVEEIVPHPSYNPHSFDSDIALIILKGQVSIGFHVRPICYPQTQNSAFEDLHLSGGAFGTVVGFGKDEDGELTEILHMARLKVVTQQEFADSFADTNFGASLTKSTTFCAGLGNGTNVCSGDSGGGIYFPVQSAGFSRWYLQGLVSVGVSAQDGTNKCDPKRFSIFTRISPYADWIVRVLSERDAL